MKFSRIASVLVIGLAAGGALAGPIGSVESDGVYVVSAANGENAARFNASEYTFYSGDSIRSHAESTVLNLNTGGGLGIPRGTEVSVVRDDDGAVRVDLQSGALLYAFPAEQRAFEFRIGNFTVTGQPREPQALEVAQGQPSVGTIERLADGNLRASVRSGELFVAQGQSVRYQVSAGETVGLLDLPQQVRTQGTTAPGESPPILMESPERVGTNDSFQVRWRSSEPVRGDYVAIAKSGAEPDEFVTVVSSDEGEILDFEAPGDPGDYEIRFIDGETGQVEKFVYLDVVERRAAGYWWDNRVIGGALAVAAGGVAIYIGAEIADDDGGRRPVSP